MNEHCWECQVSLICAIQGDDNQACGFQVIVDLERSLFGDEATYTKVTIEAKEKYTFFLEESPRFFATAPKDCPRVLKRYGMDGTEWRYRE